MSEHTPGPWHVHEDDLYADQIDVRCPDGIIAVLLREDGMEPEDIATAYLMAAAPDLLAALEAIYTWLESDSERTDEDADEIVDRLSAQTTAAISKARARS